MVVMSCLERDTNATKSWRYLRRGSPTSVVHAKTARLVQSSDQRCRVHACSDAWHISSHICPHVALRSGDIRRRSRASKATRTTRGYWYARRHGHIRRYCAARLSPVAAGPRSFSSHPNTRSHRHGHSLLDSRATRPSSCRRRLRRGPHPLPDRGSRRLGIYHLHLASRLAERRVDSSPCHQCRAHRPRLGRHETVPSNGESRTDAMTQVPGGLLTDAEIAYQLATDRPFQACLHQVHGTDPDSTTQRRAMHDGVRFHGKVASAVMTPVRLVTAILTFRNPCRVAMRTPDVVRSETRR